VMRSILSQFRRDWVQVLGNQARAFVYPPATAPSAARQLHADVCVQGYWNAFVVASLPVWVIGLWSVGHQANLAIAQLELRWLPDWQATVLATSGIGFEADNAAACFIHGLLWFLPVLAVALVVAAAWQALFSVARQRPLEPGLLYTAWFLSMLMPATVPLHLVALGMSFGIVVGKLIFGGSGRYLFNPPLLGAAFLVFSYPNLVFGPGAWVPVPGYDQPSVLELVAEEGGIRVVEAVDYTWWQLFIGDRPGAFGTTSVLGILLGAAWLIWQRVVSWRVIVGSVIGLTGTVLLVQAMDLTHPLFQVTWYWHLVLGGFAFGAVFLATDPVAGATTATGRWGFGILVGVLTVLIRLASPSYYEGVMFAILLASTFSPLIDSAVVARHVRVRRKAEGVES